MIKKVIPVIALVGASALIVGISNPKEVEKKESLINHIKSFENDVANYASVNHPELTTTLDKYVLTLENNDFEIDMLNNAQDDSQQHIATLEETQNNIVGEENNLNINNNVTSTQTNDLTVDDDLNSQINTENESINQISTLYSLSEDIETSCDDFCELKEEITEAIVETQNLIKKVQAKELELTDTQRLLITEQAQQLKNLGRQLSSVTTELTLNLSDLNTIMTANNQNIDALSLKYLIVLDNLVNGNEMLQSGLSTLNLMNQMFNMTNNEIPSNNQGRVLYGFQHNNNPPVIKDYYVDENGRVIENSPTTQDQVENQATAETDKKTINIDTYKNSNLTSNIDTYQYNKLPQNIDSFFNTALLDNEFMYGNGNNGYWGMNYGNPYLNRYTNQNPNNTLSGNDHIDNTQDVENKNNNNSKKESKRIRLKKNIDTFKDENEPDIKTKLGNIKNSIKGFFEKLKIADLSDKIERPIYRDNGIEKETN